MASIKDYFNDQNLMRELLLDHYKYPHNHGLLENDKYLSKRMASASCIDDITVQLDVEDDVIKDIRFDGVACTISTASTSIMSDLLIGKKVEEAEEIIRNYLNMIDNKDYDPEILEEANVFQNVYKQANRIKCATIGWDAVEEMLKESGKEDD
ncbi:MAG: SUF system NifU family Fe-S cluster assembly protein [Erysipelotrichaceae bacterium]|nr:SUF system NifU family Fe-S cluster assembly protein [Erysipelotrichaceae bacterium]